MTAFDPRASFPAFYQNPFIQALADVPQWTVSDNEKMPINMRELMTTGRLWGAHEISSECLLRLDELTDFLPTAANNAFYLRSQTEGFAVLDIEKECPPDIAAQLLELPSLYTERSMSGRGYHLLMPLPRNFWDYPIATGKRKLRHEQGWYEILLDHWVTFTRDVVPGAAVSATPSQQWDELYASLARTAIASPGADMSVDEDKPEIPHEEILLQLTTGQPLTITPADYHHDMSRYEFAVLRQLYKRLLSNTGHMRARYPDLIYQDSHIVWLLFEAARAMIPPRAKHEELRGGKPLLFDRALWIISRKVAESEDV